MVRPLERVNLSSAGALEAVGRYLVLTYPDGHLEWHVSDRDELVLFAYTDIRPLVESCGTAQPWVHLSQVEIEALQSGMDCPLLVAGDVWHPDGMRYPPTDPREREPVEYAEHLNPVTDVWSPRVADGAWREGGTRGDVRGHAGKTDAARLPVAGRTVRRVRAVPGGDLRAA